MNRKYTNILLERAEEGSIHMEVLLRDLLNFLSESEVVEFAKQYEYDEIFEDEEIDPHLHP